MSNRQGNREMKDSEHVIVRLSLCVHTCHVPLLCGLAFSVCLPDFPLIILVATDKSASKFTLMCAIAVFLKCVVDKSLAMLFGTRAENKALGNVFLKLCLFAFYIISI